VRRQSSREYASQRLHPRYPLGHGAPLRLQMPTTLGYKQAKYLTTLEVQHVLPAKRSYWGDQGYSWYGGL